MMKWIKSGVSALAVLLALGIFAGKYYTQPEDAAIPCDTIQELIEKGYQMESCVQVPHDSDVTVGAYEWGYVDTRLATNTTHEVKVAYVRCTIHAVELEAEKRFWETSNSVTFH